jgi:hypothetical protein
MRAASGFLLPLPPGIVAFVTPRLTDRQARRRAERDASMPSPRLPSGVRERLAGRPGEGEGARPCPLPEGLLGAIVLGLQAEARTGQGTAR